MNNTVTAMPHEILVHIFKNLAYSDLKCVRTVCKQFYVASCDNYIVTEKEKLVITPAKLFKNEDIAIRLLINTDRSFINCVVKHMHITENILQLLQNIGASILNLVLDHCVIYELTDFQIILNCCHKLKTFEIISDDTFLMSISTFDTNKNRQYPYLRKLCFENVHSLTDYMLCRMTCFFPNIEYLSFKNSGVNYHQGTYGFYYSSSVINPIEKPSNLVLTSQCIKDVIKSRTQMIKGLDFSENRISVKFLVQLLQLEGLELTELHLDECREIGQNVSLSMGLWQPNITTLSLSHCHFITDTILRELSENMIFLRILNISHCNSVTDDGLLCLKQLRKLRNLNIAYCKYISAAGLANGMCLDLYPSMEILDMRSVILNNEDDFISICNSFLNLNELYLCSCTYLTSRIFETLYSRQLCLKRLSITCSLLNDITFGATRHFSRDNEIRDRCSSILEKVHSANTYVMTFEDINVNLEAAGCDLYSISNLKKLQYLNLRNCKHLTDRSFIYRFGFEDLRELNIASTLISSQGLIYITTTCKLIESLDLSYCPVIDDSSVLIVVKGFLRLQKLSLEGCVNITENSLQYIIKYTKMLSALNLRCCRRMDINLLNVVLKLPTMVDFVMPLNDDLQNTNVPVAPPLPGQLLI